MILMPRQHMVKHDTPGWHLNLNWLLYPRRTGEIQAVLSASFMGCPFLIVPNGRAVLNEGRGQSQTVISVSRQTHEGAGPTGLPLPSGKPREKIAMQVTNRGFEINSAGSEMSRHRCFDVQIRRWVI
jgi:hypothetical protein